MNKQIILKKRPEGFPETDTWELHNTKLPKLKEGEFLIRNEYISLDPAMRGWINDTKSYIPPVQLDDVMRAGAIGRVSQSKNEKYKEGDIVTGMNGVQQYTLSDGKGQIKIQEMGMPLPKFLGVLGMPGMTAYFGFLEIGQPKEGETVLVSGAAGAVGSLVGQIAKIKGCKVIGIAGGKEKCDYLLNELNFDAAIDYKSENIWAALKEKCPNGIDVYFDNVGGQILDAALANINMKARIVVCGAISQYNNKDSFYGPKYYINLLVKRARMEGFVVFDYRDRYMEGAMQMAQWMAEGKISSKEHVVEGIENFYDAFGKLFSGKKLGKLVLKV
jgi:NADPH-dependent curcumin reductase CurA